MKTNENFVCAGGITTSSTRDDQTFLHGISHGSDEVWGRYALGYTYVATIVNGKPDFAGLASSEIKVSSKELILEEGKKYYFLVRKITVVPLRTLVKIKFRVLGEVED